jgi:exodeoxyribonuclease VII large subunit
VTAEVARSRLVVERARRRIGDPRRLVDDRRQAVDELGARAARALRTSLQQRRAALRLEETRLFRAHPQRRIGDQRKALHVLEHRLASAVRARVGNRKGALEGMVAKLSTLSPLGVLERGYSLALRPDGHLVTSIAQVKGGDALLVRFHDGQARTTVERAPADAEGGTGAEARAPGQGPGQEPSK